jgi:hypothetical protein
MLSALVARVRAATAHASRSKPARRSGDVG